MIDVKVIEFGIFVVFSFVLKSGEGVLDYV